MAARRRVVADVHDPEVTRLAAELGAARQRLAGLLVRSAADPASRERVEQAALERDTAERALAEHSLRFRTEAARMRTGLSEALAALPPRSALVAYARFRRSDLDSKGTNAGGREDYIAFVGRGDRSAPIVVGLGSAAAIDQAVARWRASVRREAEAAHPTVRAERLNRTAGAALRGLIWAPLRPFLANQTQIFIVPAGPLHLVNWGALPENGTRRYLVEEAPILHYLSSERDLLRENTAMGEGLLLVDDPRYESGGKNAARRSAATAARGCADLSDLEFDDLPATRREGDAIARRWPSQDGSVVRLSGTRATESAVRQNIAGKRVVHIATHGFFLGSWCNPQTTATEIHPLLLAGLAFAGANQRRDRPASDDGVLLAEEIATLDLRGVDWAVLSACDTGAGVLRAGDELFGLRRMFQVAGVNTVIVSLWPVDDETTRRWMTTVYEARFTSGKPTAEAVRTATVEAIARRRARGESTHPAYWASFIAAGKW
jgi:CHAT domain-containing protein